MKKFISYFYILLFSLIIFNSKSFAQDVEYLLQKGIKQYNDLEYEESINSLSAALVTPGATKGQIIKIYQYLGLNYLILGKEKEAEGAFRGLLAMDENWSFDPATTSPKVMEFFNKVKAKWIEDGKPGKTLLVGEEKIVNIIHKIPGEGKEGHEINLNIEIENPRKIPVRVLVFYKNSTQDTFTETLAVEKKPVDEKSQIAIYSVTIPETFVHGLSVDYFIKVIDMDEKEIGSKGDEKLPLRIPISQAEDKKRKKKALVGGLIGGIGGAVLIGVILAVTLPIALKKEEPPSHQPAIVTVVISE